MCPATTVRSRQQRHRIFKPDGPAGEAAAIPPEEVLARLEFEPGARLLEQPKPIQPPVEQQPAPGETAESGPVTALMQLMEEVRPVSEPPKEATAVVEPPKEAGGKRVKTGYAPPSLADLEAVASPVDGSKTVAQSERVQAFIRRYGRKGTQ